MISKDFLSRTLTVVSTLVLLGSTLTTNSWAMISDEIDLSHSIPISSFPTLKEEGQNLQQQKVIVNNQKAIGFVQEIFDPHGTIKGFNDNMAREFFEDLGCTVAISYPGTDWAGNKRGKTMVSFGIGEDEKKLIYHQGFSEYEISPCIKQYIKQFLTKINRTPENLIIQ